MAGRDAHRSDRPGWTQRVQVHDPKDRVLTVHGVQFGRVPAGVSAIFVFGGTFMSILVPVGLFVLFVIFIALFCDGGD